MRDRCHWTRAFMVSIVTGLAIVGAPFEARAWSRDGHRVTALVAEALLTPIARHNLQAILGAEDLASASVWADDIRSGGHGRADRPETASWHFVDMPLDADRFEPTADYCRRGCVPSKIDALVDEMRSELDESTHRRRPLSSAERRRLRDA